MTTQVKFRRGTTAQNQSFKGTEGELTVDLGKKTVRVHDGITVGGYPLALEEDIDILLSKESAASIYITPASTQSLIDEAAFAGINAGDGITFVSGQVAVNAGDGITFVSGQVAVNAGDGLTVVSGQVAVNAGDGITFVSGRTTVNNSIARVSTLAAYITQTSADLAYTPNSIGNNFITPEFYGAVGDIITDDTAAVQAAFDSGKIVFLNSFYRTTSPIAITLNSARRSLAVYGGGKQQSGFYITHSDVGLDIKLSDASAPIGQFNQDVVFRDFAVVSNGAYAAGTGIKISGQPGIGSSEPAIRFDNIAVKPISTAHYFNTGMRLSNVRNGTISNCDVFGYWGNYTGIGIELAAVGSAAPVHMHITDCNISHYNYGIRILPANVGLTTSDYQGVHLRGNNIIAVNYGILAQNSDNQSDQLMITENHCNFRISGIHVEGWKRVFVTDNFCLAYGTIPASTAHGILLTTTGINSIYGFVSNNCVDFSSPTNASSDERGIRVLQGSGGATRVFLTNNMVISADTQYEVPANNILTTSAVAVIGGVNNYSA